ncbi:hypothetical protein ACFQ0M_48865 [Kitasatospora aburaviensis]|uniref:Integral membrane protein n=1 Tax=Kitasatospora aburaviensis TaxID=67265 RepID=A0ABW1F4K5_9ACTN
MTGLPFRAYEPRTQIAALLALLSLITALTWALTHGLGLGSTAVATGLAYGAVSAFAEARWRVDPYALLAATARFPYAVITAAVLAMRQYRRREGWA